MSQVINESASARVVRSRTLAASMTGLVVSREVLGELRVALLADVLSVREEFFAMLDEIESEIARAGEVDELDDKRRRWRHSTAAIKVRHEVHEMVGVGGVPLVARTITGRDHCGLAVEVLMRHRQAQLARLARRDVADGERSQASETVERLGTFLDDLQLPRR